MRWRRRNGRTAILVACALTVAALLGGCGASPGPDVGPHFVTPPLIRYTTVLWPVPLQLVGAEPGSRLRLVATVPTKRGVWSSSATYTVPGTGTVDLAIERPQLARFTEPDSAGLFWSLRGPSLTPSEVLKLWMRTTLPVTIDVYDAGRVVASRVFRLDGLGTTRGPITVYSSDLDAASARAGDRRPPLGLPDPPPPTTHENGPIGRFYSATSIERPRTPAVVVFDDPALGASADYVAPLLAQFGASVFMLPMARDADGLHAAGAIDSSTVAAVLDWLQSRPDVNARSIFAYGTSQSEQFALWAAARFGGRFAGAIGAGGVSAHLCLAAGDFAPVFENGVGLRCVRDATQVDARSVIPLGSVRGPVVLGCAGHDAVLPNSCAWQRAVLATHTARASDRLVEAPASTHAMTVPPGLPIALPSGDGQSTQKARIAFWDAVGAVLLRAARQ